MIELILLGTLAVGGVALALEDSDGDDDELRTIATEGADSLRYGSASDLIEAGRGYDTVEAGAGDDTVSAGPGQDVVLAGSGDDSVSGDEFHDILYGQSGDDLLLGGGGTDVLFGGNGDDTLDGGTWDDTLVGGNGNDQLIGGAGDDALGGINVNRAFTVAEARALYLEDEVPDSVSDVHYSVQADGADTLDGGDGDDTLFLGRGDTGTGGAGNDDFELHPNQEGGAVIVITDYSSGEDSVQIALEDANGNPVQPVRSDYAVETDEETGDALILERGEVIARLQGAGGSFSIEDLVT